MTHSRCGTCRFAEAIKDDLKSVTCYGVPPSPVLMPVQVMTPQGMKMDMQVQLLRPGLARSEHACALYQPAELPVIANADAEVSE